MLIRIADVTKCCPSDGAGLLTPCELEGDPRERFALNARGVVRRRALAPPTPKTPQRENGLLR